MIIDITRAPKNYVKPGVYTIYLDKGGIVRRKVDYSPKAKKDFFDNQKKLRFA